MILLVAWGCARESDAPSSSPPEANNVVAPQREDPLDAVDGPVAGSPVTQEPRLSPVGPEQERGLPLTIYADADPVPFVARTIHAMDIVAVALPEDGVFAWYVQGDIAQAELALQLLDDITQAELPEQTGGEDDQVAPITAEWAATDSTDYLRSVALQSSEAIDGFPEFALLFEEGVDVYQLRIHSGSRIVALRLFVDGDRVGDMEWFLPE